MTRKSVLILFALFVMSCTNSSFDAYLPPVETVAAEVPDPNMTEIEITDDNVADGITPATVNLRFRSAAGNPVAGIDMSLWASGSDNVVVPCTTSDANGRSRCLLYTTRAEVKSLRLTGAFTMTSSIAFTAPKPLRSNFSFVSAAGDARLPSGHRLVSTAGIVEGPFRQKDSLGHVRLRSSVLSSIIDE